MKKVVVIGIFLALGLVIYSCVTNKEAVSALPEPAITAMGVSEGILINFDNITADTSRLFIMLKDATENDETLTFVDIRDEELEAVKSTRSLTCPFTIKGHVYRISIVPYTDNDNIQQECVNVAAIAAGGSYPKEKPIMRSVGEQYEAAGDLPVYIETLRSLSEGDTPWVIGLAKKEDFIALLD